MICGCDFCVFWFNDLFDVLHCHKIDIYSKRIYIWWFAFVSFVVFVVVNVLVIACFATLIPHTLTLTETDAGMCVARRGFNSNTRDNKYYDTFFTIISSSNFQWHWLVLLLLLVVLKILWFQFRTSINKRVLWILCCYSLVFFSLSLYCEFLFLSLSLVRSGCLCYCWFVS